MKNFLLAFAAYPLISFPLAIAWHLVVFKRAYDELGYISREEPIIAFDFLAMAVQGILLAWAYPFFYRGGHPAKAGLKFGLVTGTFLWSSHVIATAAKHQMSSIPAFVAIETVYLAIQFALVGLAIGMIYGRVGSQTPGPG